MDAASRKRGGRGRGKVGNQDITNAVLEAIFKSGNSRVADLAMDLGVSEVSVRKSLNKLESQGLVRRYHGEARLYDGDDIPFRMHLHYAEKQAIARRAAELVATGDTILLEAGSAIAMFAQRIRDVKGLTIVTTNLFIARMFRGTKTQVVVLGGLYQEESESLVGPAVCDAVRQIAFSKAFIGVSGFTFASGFMLNDVARADVTRTILERGAECGARTWVLTDSSKFGVSHAAVVCPDLSLVSGIVTDPGITKEYSSHFVAAGLQVLTGG
ncbi:MAG TPA: DeoR/GlpR family DNA-binding transcription regulator [Spirochaetia bacterium]|nr:DeoR/GlpR family DNA-binding transcription regulator [Spirochaetia bacterium]